MHQMTQICTYRLFNKTPESSPPARALTIQLFRASSAAGDRRRSLISRDFFGRAAVGLRTICMMLSNKEKVNDQRETFVVDFFKCQSYDYFCSVFLRCNFNANSVN